MWQSVAIVLRADERTRFVWAFHATNRPGRRTQVVTDALVAASPRTKQLTMLRQLGSVRLPASPASTVAGRVDFLTFRHVPSCAREIAEAITCAVHGNPCAVSRNWELRIGHWSRAASPRLLLSWFLRLLSDSAVLRITGHRELAIGGLRLRRLYPFPNFCLLESDLSGALVPFCDKIPSAGFYLGPPLTAATGRTQTCHSRPMAAPAL
jgi:hypothetical protein